MGSLKKTFSNNQLIFKMNDSTIQDVVDYLIKHQSGDYNDFDGKNVMIAVNGKDSSALNGLETIVKSGDIVTIIPIIHGGANTRIQFKIGQNFRIKKT